ncbi:MAG TPA: RHS repeat-associated core domain-containing protein, partial [Candidatus Cloacimonadota bacterium]|nr:RHS repeat-associated core domain-containing protein [Candidatus Cloacimonadota bacterium]
KKLTTENIYNEKGLITHKRLPNYYSPPLNSSPSNWVVSFNYDHYGNLLSKTSPDYGTVEYRYDIADRLTSKKDAVNAQSNKIVYYQYDILNRLVETGTILGVLVNGQLVYNDNQKLWLQRNTYDRFGTNSGLHNALFETQTRNSTNLATVIERYKYDRYGNITEKAVSSSSFDPNTYYATKYTYDPAGNVTRIEYPQCDYPNQLIITNYLPHDYFALTSISNGTEDKPAEITIQSGQDITFKAQESITLLPGFTVKEGAIFKSEIGVVSTRPIEYVTYSYDNDKRIKTIGTVNNPNRYAEYTYGDNDELNQERINNRNNTYFDINYSYNSPLWPLSIACDLYLEELDYTGNYNGNVSSIFHTVFDYPQNSYLYNFQWDTAGRLISANNPADPTGTNYNYTAIEYDANGNIMASERSSASQFRSYNYSYLPETNKVNQVSYVYGSNRESANQITNHSNYVYDANGSVLSSSKLNKTLLMDYDIRSNLVSSIAVNNQYIIDYDYDASGERVYSGMGSSSKIYINSITSNPLTIIDSNDNVTHYIYGPKGIVAKRNESLTYYMLKDHLGSTRVVMNENNQAISSYDYDAWGNPMNSTVSEESAYRYTGREYDEETGLHNFRARLYDSVLMRFYQVDPAEQFATPYVYCGNNPIGLVDPDGKDANFDGYDDNDKLYGYLSNSFLQSPFTVNDDGFVIHLIGPAKGTVTLEESSFWNVVDDHSLLVTLTFDPDGIGKDGNPIFGGVYEGNRNSSHWWNFSKYDFKAKMTVNLLSMQNYEEVGGCDVGSSFIHEFREGYYGIKLFPNQGYSEYNQNTAHNMTTLFENNKIYPKAGGTRLITESVFTPPWYRRTCEETCYWELNGKKIYWTIKHTTIGK